MSNTMATRQVNIGSYALSVTTRFVVHDAPEIREELTFRTIGAWLYIVGLLEKGTIECPLESVEKRLSAEKGIGFTETFTDSRVTVWDTYRGAKNPSFHLNSDDTPQDAINTWLANNRAIERAIEKFGVSASQNAPKTPEIHDSSNAPAQPAVTLTDGVIMAKRAPNPKTPEYAAGQKVGFTITKIAVGSNKGSATYALWGSLGGGRYPLKTIYKCKPNSDENSKDYIAVKEALVGLGLSLDKPEIQGNWRLICEAAHVEQQDKTIKEYLNVLSLEAIT